MTFCDASLCHFQDWNPATKEDVLAGDKDPFYVYAASKAIAERSLWEWAESHPEIDVTTSERSRFL